MVKTLKASALPAANTAFKVMDENATVGTKPAAKKAGATNRAALKEMTNQVIKPNTAFEKKDLKSTVKSSALKKSETKTATTSRLRKDPAKGAALKPKMVSSSVQDLAKFCDPMDVDLIDLEDWENPLKKIKKTSTLNPVMDPLRSIPSDILDIDTPDHGDPQFASEYVPFIFAFLREKEIEDRVFSDYMSEQAEVNARHREILVDWMADVALKFRFLSDTLFIAVGILDRFLVMNTTVKRSKLQLVGTTALFIAAKFEEIATPDVNDFIYVSASAYSREEIIEMEKSILVALDFNITFPTALTFLRRFSKAASSEASVHALSKYIIELSVMDYALVRFLPSEIAAAAVYLSRAMNRRPAWEKNVEFYSGFNEADILPCARELNVLLKSQATTKQRAITNKYMSSSYMKVALTPSVDI